MAWEVDKPDGSDPIQTSDDYVRANFVAISTAFSSTHIYPGTTGTRGQHTPGDTPIIDAETEAVLIGYADVAGAISYPTDLYTLYTNNGASWDARSAIESGTYMMFYQVAAPVGWTMITTIHDSLAMVTSAATSGTGLWSGGTWTISGLGWSHTHGYSETPKHTHGWACSYAGDPVGTRFGAANAAGYTRYTDYTGATGTTASTSGSLVSDGTWRPARALCIICSRDA